MSGDSGVPPFNTSSSGFTIVGVNSRSDGPSAGTMPTRFAVLLLALTTSGCLHAAHEYSLDAQPDALRAATEQAAGKLGWTLAAAQGGRFFLVDAPRGPVEVAVKEGKLELSGARAALSVAPLFAATTRQELFHTGGERLTPRSTAATLVLDALVPAAGLLFLGPGDVTVPALSGESFGLELVMRLMFDLLAAEMFWLSTIDRTPALFVGYGIGLLVLNRALAMVMDVRSLELRNSLAARGSPVPTAEAVWRERANARVLW